MPKIHFHDYTLAPVVVTIATVNHMQKEIHSSARDTISFRMSIPRYHRAIPIRTNFVRCHWNRVTVGQNWHLCRDTGNWAAANHASTSFASTMILVPAVVALAAIGPIPINMRTMDRWRCMNESMCHRVVCRTIIMRDANQTPIMAMRSETYRPTMCSKRMLWNEHSHMIDSLISNEWMLCGEKHDQNPIAAMAPISRHQFKWTVQMLRNFGIFSRLALWIMIAMWWWCTVTPSSKCICCVNCLTFMFSFLSLICYVAC